MTLNTQIADFLQDIVNAMGLALTTSIEKTTGLKK